MQIEECLEMPIKRPEIIAKLVALQKESGDLELIMRTYKLDTVNEVLETYCKRLLINGMTLIIAWNAMCFIVDAIKVGDIAEDFNHAVHAAVDLAAVYECIRGKEITS